MAGDHGHLKIDPSIEKWAAMRENTHLHFRWTPKTVRSAFIWAAVVPVGLTWLAFKSNNMWHNIHEKKKVSSNSTEE
ncbi:uncharacterized protein VTP21DRAFT_11680 [Calcarisporiella thermophila]|uniref:uncharacterized protein n=1 Tax=Calcarisporiella thermophila TaxID=911321 RepID=UPI00374251F3